MKNIIINDDCRKIMREMDKNSVDCIITDIPYNELKLVDNNGFTKAKHIATGVHDNADDLDLQEILSEFVRICKGSFYIFCGMNQVSIIHNFFKAKGFNTRMIVWEKTNPCPLNGEFLWLQGIEICMFAKKSRATYNYHCRNTVLRYPLAKKTGHPTPKNEKLMEELILASTNEKDIVFDPFAGAGTTAIGCIRTNRDFICVEKDAYYFKLMQNRIAKETALLEL